MGSCIICGTSVDGHICDIHQEDVVFEFRGNRPEQLTTNRFYRGSVDGFAEFGVFVDIGDSVTGLLHESELDRRLDSLDWAPGDYVFVKVKNVRDNGNVDLGWSIRQAEREFRGMLIDDPSKDYALLSEEEADDEEANATDGGSTGATETTVPDAGGGVRRRKSDASASAASAGSTGGSTATGGGQAVLETPDRVAIDTLADHAGDRVRLEGVVDDVHQTSGPTVFTLRDESGSVECAAFEAAGVRAYPDVEAGDVARFEGEVEKRHGDVQLETEALVVLEDDERATVEDRLSDALDAEARPEAVDLIAEDDAVAAVSESLVNAATAIRRAVMQDRPVVVRHTASADGYVGAVAIERATLPLVGTYHAAADAVYHYFDRRPLEDGVYDMADATKDVTTMLDNSERHGEKLPLFVFVAAGGTRESVDGFDLLDVYDADAVVVDDVIADDAVVDAVETTVTPPADAVAATTATALAANVAVHVNDDVRAELQHLPAVSYWDDTPEAYADAASAAGYDAEDTRDVRQAVALEAYYQSYEDKRELIADLLFDSEGEHGLATHVSEQFRTKMSTAVETAETNLETRTVDDTDVTVLDTDAFTHRYEFPPTDLLLDELFRRSDAPVLVGVADNELHLRTATPVDVHGMVESVRDAVPKAGVTAASAHEGIVEYLAGERDAVLDAVLDDVVSRA